MEVRILYPLYILRTFLLFNEFGFIKVFWSSKKYKSGQNISTSIICDNYF